MTEAMLWRNEVCFVFCFEHAKCICLMEIWEVVSSRFWQGGAQKLQILMVFDSLSRVHKKETRLPLLLKVPTNERGAL